MLYVKVDRFRKNHWQVREKEDDERVQALAADIASRRASKPATKGLLQVPAGRLCRPDGQPVTLQGYSQERADVELSQGLMDVQLAYGHRRLAAFRLLAETDHFYAHMPVDLVWFDDEEMATAAWSENAARQDLTPLEQARAISLMLDGFGWTQQQAAEKLGLSQPTVANKLRLLKLPVDQRRQVQEGTLSERQALALLPLTELPEAAVEKLPQWRKDDIQRLVEKPGEKTSQVIRDGVKRIVEAATEDLEKADFPLAFELVTDGVRAASCEACEQRMGRGRSRCQDPACFAVRTFAWRRGVLAPIAEELGIPLLDPEVQQGLNYAELAYFYSGSGGEDLAFARAEGCENLRVAWQDGGYYADVDGHEHAMLICYHGKGKKCSCKQGRRREEDAAEKAREKARRQAVNRAKGKLAARVAEALDAGETWALRAVLVEVGGYANRDAHRAVEDRDVIVQKVTKALVHGALGWHSLGAGNLAEVEEKVQEWLVGIGATGQKNSHELHEEISPLATARGAGRNDNGDDGLADIRRRWARIQGWMETPMVEREEAGTFSEEAIQGNIDNMDQLLAELVEIDEASNGQNGAEIQNLIGEISEAAYQLEGMV